MAPLFFLFQALVLSIFHLSAAQTIIGSSSSFSNLALPSNAPAPTKQTVRFWPSLPPRGRSDVPIRVTIRDRYTTLNAVEQEQRMIQPTTQFTHSFTFTQSAESPSRRQIVTQAAASRPRTDTASLAFIAALTKQEGAARGPTLPNAVAESADKKANEDLVHEAEDEEGLGSGGALTGRAQEDSPEVRLTEDEMAQYRQQAQTMVPVDDEPGKPRLFALTASSTTTADSTTPPHQKEVLKTSKTAQTSAPTTETQPSKDRVGLEPDVSVSMSQGPPSETAESESAGRAVTARSQASPRPNAPSVSQSSSADVLTATQKANGTTTTQSSKSTQSGRDAANTTVQSSRKGITSPFTSSIVPVIRSRFGPTYQTERNRSLPLGHPQPAPHSTLNPVLPPSARPSTNATLLYWGDLSRTLAFAWELHVYGTASLFLLLFAGAALGLMLSPGANCPQRGALALANALLFLAGGLRAALFFIDPYGTRNLLPHHAVAALYNLPLHLLVWTQASLALLALKVAEVTALPPTLQHPPLVAVLTVLQSTLLLAADLLSPALSPLVPVTLQVMSLCWGLALCFGFLCHVFPRIRCPSPPHAAAEGRGMTWIGGQKVQLILTRVLAVCAVIGTLCCGLHIHATLWLYGLLGNWTHFSWGWWLVHFWARLLELTWAFFMLLLASWVFWRPSVCRRREEGGQDGSTAADLASPGQSVGSTQRHTCWAKIVQSLRGKPCRKSDSNGVGGGGVVGEIPNNWTGHERMGADISKSLIRNQNHEQNTVQLLSIKDNNSGRSHGAPSVETGQTDGSPRRLQTLGQPPQRSVSGNLDQDRDTSLSFCEFDLRPPSPIDLTRSIDNALNREHFLDGGSLFHPLNQTTPSPSPGSGFSQEGWLRRNSDPQLLSESSEALTESSMPLGGSVLSSVPSRQVTAPPTPSHQGHRWAGKGAATVPSSVSCPVSLRPSKASTGHLDEDCVDDTRPFITPDSDRAPGRAGRPVGSRSYLEVSRRDESAIMSSDIIDL